MNYIILSILSLVIGFWLGWKSRGGEKEKMESANKPEFLAGGLGKINEENKAQKEERKARILELFQAKNSIANNDVQALLGVSDATATNYLAELEKEGKIEQTGVSGRFVTYKLKG
ncbi:MAG: hypothetical protein C0412_12375 [Flavobacterium sp.]|nr:hypothetical protein [Flavobacterium sp.]